MADHHNRDSRPDSQVTRRNFLASAPVAVALTAAPVAALALPQEVAEVAENPKLLALAAELPKVEKDYHDAVAAWQQMWRTWSPKWPAAPDPCCNFNWMGTGGMIERDLAGAGLVRPGRERPVKIDTISEMERHVDWMRAALAKDDRKKKGVSKKTRDYWQSEISRCEIGVQLLPGYEAECERIRRESRYNEFNHARRGRAEALFAFVHKVLMEESRTLDGVRIKAQAVAAIDRMQAYDRVFAQSKDLRNGDGMAGLLSAAILRVI